MKTIINAAADQNEEKPKRPLPMALKIQVPAGYPQEKGYAALFSPQVQAVFDAAANTARQPGGPHPSPADWRDQIIYFLMVDRFNNPYKLPAHSPYGDPACDRFQGGVFSGVRQQLAYIKNLGAGAIRLSPVLKNPPSALHSYHGYDTQDFLRAEPRFADHANHASEELRGLVDAAHQAGLYVIFDIVLKPMLNGSPELQRYLIRAYQYVMARYDADGFRIDSLRHLKGSVAQTFCNAIREFALSIGKENFLTFGDAQDGETGADIARFIGRNTRSGADGAAGVDAVLDYPLCNTLNPVIKGLAAPAELAGLYAMRKRMEQQILSSHGDATRFFVTFLDNHDIQQRLRYLNQTNPQEFDDQVSLSLACLYALPGIPCVYYGTEQGLSGTGSEHAVREALWGITPNFPQDSRFYLEMQKLAAVRAATPALRYGRLYFRPVSIADSNHFSVSALAGGILVWSRILNDQEVLIAANTNAMQSGSAKVIIDKLLSAPGRQFRLRYSNKPQPAPPTPVEIVDQAIVTEVDGATGHGPLHIVQVSLQPMEVQILQR